MELLNPKSKHRVAIGLDESEENNEPCITVLFVPDITSPEHYHIEIPWDKVETLRNALTKILHKKRHGILTFGTKL